MKCFAILGNNAELSKLEIKTILGSEIQQFSDSVIFFETEMDLFDLQNTLGGTIKLGEVTSSYIRENDEDTINHIADLVLQRRDEGKIQFGLSVYNTGDNDLYRIWQKKKNAFGIKIKKVIKESGRSVRFVDSKNESLSAADIIKNGILKKGAEIVILPTQNKVYIGVTMAVQDINDWSWRDFERPARDAKRGMLPPKLARIMVNIAGSQKGKILLDPFCGSGTVLMEAAIVGCEKIIGSDISERAVDDTEINLAWLRSTKKMPKIQLYTSAAENLKAILLNESVDTIVTEPFLGSPRQGDESIQNIENAINELETLYQISFSVLSDILKHGGTLVVALPIHIIRNEWFEVNQNTIFKNTQLKLDP
ncbi:methyltransferase domain-containing protein, partial [Patescibacteria group bacterium]|nr:methyltransferase domain-containing protein [Patescibacteria group bacterium]